jgi:hypothetical protein
MKMRLILSVMAGIAVCGVAEASVFQVMPNGSGYEAIYTADIPLTLNGNAITNVMIFEEGAGGQVKVSPYQGTLAAGGVSVLTDPDLQFAPTLALVIGTDLTTPFDSTGKRHLVFFLSDALAASAAGKEFSQVFPPLHEQAFIDDLIAARTDSTKLGLLTDYFTSGPLAQAAFAPGGSFSVVESSTFPPAVPEPATVIIWSLLSGLGIGIGWWRMKKAA